MSERIQSPTKLPSFITRAMSWGYGIGIGHVNRKFDRGVGVTKLDVPVISIGNLSAGGTGKTPMVHWVAQQLIDSGKKPVIAMRGYKANPGEMGDEEREHRLALPGMPVVAQPDRIAGLEKLFASEEQVDCVILDDGFQHRKIARGLDVVLIDASSVPYRDALLPRGFLRDPASSLLRADTIVITHREMVSDEQLGELVGWIKGQVPDCPVVVTSHRWASVTVYTASDDGWKTESLSIEQIKGERVLGVCAIGNPDGFFGQIESSGWGLVERIALGDHDAFDQGVIDRVCELAKSARASMVCMTRKDWVKAQDRMQMAAGLKIAVPELKLVFESGEDQLQELVIEASSEG